MDSDNFVLTTGSDGKVMAGGYIINSRLLVPSMSGGKKNNEKDDELNTTQYAIPTGLYYTKIPYVESSVEMIYENHDVLPDDIYDNLYNSAKYIKSDNEEILPAPDNKRTSNNNKNKNNKNNKNTKKRKIKSNNKKSRKQK